jgi:hypothetical protein
MDILINEAINNFDKIPNDFDWKTYLDLNIDLNNLKTKEQAINHYLNYGFNEKRRYSRNNLPSVVLPNDFDWKTYLDLNHDLNKLTTKEEALNHYLNYGFDENRIYSRAKLPPANFNWKIYLDLNPDLNKLKTKEEVINHYLNYGINENRSYAIYELPDDFDWKIYLDLNPDLNKLKTKEEAIHHYLTFGKYETRFYKYIVADDFDWKCYLEINSDLKYNTEFECIGHYLKYGINERRCYKRKKQQNEILPTDFNWETYLFYNKDIAAHFNKKEETENHYLNYGKKENRKYQIENKIYNLFKTKKISYYDDLYNISSSIIENNKLLIKEGVLIQDKDFIINNYKKSINFEFTNELTVNDDYLKTPNYSSFNFCDLIQNDLILKNDNLISFLNIYDSIILIIDLPLNVTGGSRFFIDSIIKKYKNNTTFLIAFPIENNFSFDMR